MREIHDLLFEKATEGMTAEEVLNYYRNLYHGEPQSTEHGIVANALNDILPRMIVPPCKVGDTVYVVNETVGKVFRNTVIGITIGESKNTNSIKVEYRNIYGETSCRKFRWAQFGKQVFFTRKEAEQALKGGESDGTTQT